MCEGGDPDFAEKQDLSNPQKPPGGSHNEKRRCPHPPNLLKLAQRRLRKECASPGAHTGAQGPAELGQAERVHVRPP